MSSDRPSGVVDRRSAVKRCVLHIGTEKTGTSTVQHFLSNNRQQLAREGFVYPRYTGLNGGSQWGFVAAVADDIWHTDIGARLDINDERGVIDYRSKLIAAIDEEIAACEHAHTLLISCEHFHSRLKTQEVVARLREFLSRWCSEFEVLVYFRRQDKVAVSHYSTKLKSGNPNPQAFPDMCRGLPYYYDYARVFDNWAAVFGVEATKPRIFEPQELEQGDLLADFCQQSGLKLANKKRPAPVNESLSEQGVALFLELNHQWPLTREAHRDMTRRKLAGFISRSYRGKNHPAARKEARAFYEQCRDSNERLAKTAFPARNSTLFVEDFSDYPEEKPRPAKASGEEVGELINVWRLHGGEPGKAALPVRSLRNALGSVLIHGGRNLARLQQAVATLGQRRWQRKPSGLPPFYLHVGLPKTGTTTLQNTLFSHHPELCYLGKSADYDFPRGFRSRELHHLLNPLLKGRGRYPAWRELRRGLDQQLSGVEGKALLGSWETLGIQRPPDFKQLIYDMEAAFGDVHVIFTLRNPLTRLPSAYLQALRAAAKHGEHHTLPKGSVFVSFEEWLRTNRSLDGHDSRFDFGDNIRFATDYLGPGKVGIFLLEQLKEDAQAYHHRIAEFMGLDGMKAEQVETGHLNSALTVDEVALLQEYERKGGEEWLSMPSRRRKDLLEQVRDTGVQEPFKVTVEASQAAYIHERSASLNRWLDQTFALELGRHGYPL